MYVLTIHCTIHKTHWFSQQWVLCCSFSEYSIYLTATPPPPPPIIGTNQGMNDLDGQHQSLSHTLTLPIIRANRGMISWSTTLYTRFMECRLGIMLEIYFNFCCVSSVAIGQDNAFLSLIHLCIRPLRRNNLFPVIMPTMALQSESVSRFVNRPAPTALVATPTIRDNHTPISALGGNDVIS